MNRKKSILLFICTVCLLLLASCGKQEDEPVETEWSTLQMAQAVWDSQPALDSQTLLYGENDFDSYLADAYQIAPADVIDGTVLYAGGVNAQEIAVLQMKEAADVQTAVKAFADYIYAREGAFTGYAPEQAAILELSATAERGRYAVLLICPDQDAARDTLAKCFAVPPPAMTYDPNAIAIKPEPIPQPEPEPQPVTEPEPAPDPEPAPQPEPEPEQEPGPEPDPQPEPVPAPEPEPDSDWAYDESRIIAAWTSGGRDGLYAEDLAILSVLDQIPALTDTSLSAYDRELALHDWMLDWAEYDPGALSSGPRGDPIPHNDNPYGFLVGKKGICLGYSTTFQLFMDIIGIECVTVPGTAHAGTDDHAWNLVKLDGEWYAVDVTWDDPVSSIPMIIPKATAHRYFNVTSDFLREHDHQWTEEGVPEAAGTALAWAG